MCIRDRLRKDLLEGFEDSGVTLPPDKRARAKAIFDELETLRQAFDRNIRDDPTKVLVTEAELEGLPEAYRQGRKRDDQGRYVLGLDSPSYQPFMANARNAAARERYFRARTSQGGQANMQLIDELYGLRKELAGLYGLPSFAAYAVRHRMVRTPEVVDKFLADVKGAVMALEKREIE